MNVKVMIVSFLCCLFAFTGIEAQEFVADTVAPRNLELPVIYTSQEGDTIMPIVVDELVAAPDYELQNALSESDTEIVAPDSAAILKEMRQHERHMRYINFMPDPNKSLWYALAFPGLGQIYNRKYWKLPIVYGGVVGVVYAISWNGTKYNDYMRAYRDVTDSNPNTNYHLEVIPYGYPESSAETYVRNRMNVYRRYRDIAIVVGVAFYAITVIDAFVDAQLAGFDISPDLSMKVRPKIDTQPSTNMPAIGCQMQFSF